MGGKKKQGRGKGKSKTTSGVDNVQDVLSKSEQFIEKNQKRLLTIVCIVIAVVLGILAFFNLYLEPRENEARKLIYQGEQYFKVDSFRLALEGDDNFIGFEAIKEQFGMTKTANLASAYIGLCYKELGEYDNAIDALKDFDANDNMIAPAIIVAIGDCYVETGKIKESIDYFLKASDKADNELISPIALKKAAVAHEKLKEYDKAIKLYTVIQDKYYNSPEGRDMQKFIDRATALKASPETASN